MFCKDYTNIQLKEVKIKPNGQKEVGNNRSLRGSMINQNQYPKLAEKVGLSVERQVRVGICQ